ncbi:efflux RND transporter periplasmic adaptor subunit [Vibrio salinus]|uniref:efflux RND transporter periplasmic adaptor subunit n=1 Tax=Vibrio salinus TaxID=2899784 RepID=UPI001E63E7AF|nr:efflux RND transporter periplasmic adaptor subunit [Vibrio salinus]MCE0493625.1 efflux RND transporter periplasmic adaptor subunit [Vibrio salinus]
MKHDIYAYITTSVLAVAIGFSAFLVISDNKMPFTTQATVKTTSVDVVPEVSGYISQMMVKEGQPVTKGTLLFQIDQQNYQIALQKAQAAARKSNSQWKQARRYSQRIQSLSTHSSVSQETLDEAQAEARIDKATMLAAQADLRLAQLNLNRTNVYAQDSGVVTNLTYRPGMYVTPAKSVIHLVSHQKKWIEADFAEKGLQVLSQHPTVNIVFDAYPNQLFHGKIISVDSAIQSGVNPQNQLADIKNESRWIRPQQKVRVRIESHLPKNIIAGSRASVMVKDHHRIADIWMTLLSWMRFIY